MANSSFLNINSSNQKLISDNINIRLHTVSLIPGRNCSRFEESSCLNCSVSSRFLTFFALSCFIRMWFLRSSRVSDVMGANGGPLDCAKNGTLKDSMNFNQFQCIAKKCCTPADCGRGMRRPADHLLLRIPTSSGSFAFCADYA